MGNSFVLFDVSIVISHGQFPVGIKVTHKIQTSHGPSHFPVEKRSSGTATLLFLLMYL